MKRFLLITCASLILVAPASANLARVAGMGGIGLFMMDDSNVDVFPQSLADFSNRAIGELGTRGSPDSERWAGVHLHMKKLGVHGSLYVNRPGPQLRHGFVNVADHGRHNVFGVAGEEGNWGVQLGLGGDKFKLTPDPDFEPPDGTLIDEKTTTISVGAGVDFDYSDKAQGELGARVGIASGSQDFQGDTDSKIDESLFDLNVVLRNWYDRGEHGKLVAIGTFGLGSGSIKFPTTTPRGGALEEDKVSSVAAGVGAAWHYPAAKNVTVIAGVEPIGFATAKDEDIFDTSTATVKTTAITYLSWFFGMEANFKKWLVGRVGASQSNSNVKIEDTFEDTSRGAPITDEVTINESQFQISLGLGAKLGDNLMVDGVFNEDLFYSGPYLLTGEDVDGDDFLTRVSIWGRW